VAVDGRAAGFGHRQLWNAADRLASRGASTIASDARPRPCCTRVTGLAANYWAWWAGGLPTPPELAPHAAQARVFGMAFRSEGRILCGKVRGRPCAGSLADSRSVAAVPTSMAWRITLLEHLPEMDLYTRAAVGMGKSRRCGEIALHHQDRS